MPTIHHSTEDQSPFGLELGGALEWIGDCLITARFEECENRKQRGWGRRFFARNVTYLHVSPHRLEFRWGWVCGSCASSGMYIETLSVATEWSSFLCLFIVYRVSHSTLEEKSHV